MYKLLPEKKNNHFLVICNKTRQITMDNEPDFLVKLLHTEAKTPITNHLINALESCGLDVQNLKNRKTALDTTHNDITKIIGDNQTLIDECVRLRPELTLYMNKTRDTIRRRSILRKDDDGNELLKHSPHHRLNHESILLRGRTMKTGNNLDDLFMFGPETKDHRKQRNNKFIILTVSEEEKEYN